MIFLFFTDELSEKNGWGRYSLDLVLSLQGLGHQVLVICNHQNNSFPQIKQKELLFNPLNYRLNYLLFWLIALKIYFFTYRSEFTVIHCLVEIYAPIAWFFSVLKRKPMFVTLHGSFGLKPLFYYWPGKLQRFIYRNKRTKIVCISNYTKFRLIKKLGFSPKIQIIPNGVNLSKIGNRQPLLNVRQPITLLGVGALKQRKGFHLVVEALPKILGFFPEVRYWIVGNQRDKVYVEKLKERIQELGLVDHISFFENISDEKLNDLYCLASLFVLTPLSNEYNFEGFGLVYLEANSFGLPVVGMKDNGGEEAIVHGKTGLLSETGDIDSISESVIKILGDPNIYAMMSANALVWSQNHNWVAISKKYLDFYSKND